MRAVRFDLPVTVIQRALGVAVMLILAVGQVFTQTRSAADGPWSGWVQCELTAQLDEPGRTYFNQQVHTWVLAATAPTPTSGTDIKEYPATWTVVGGGTGVRQDGNGRTIADKWNTAGQPKSTTIGFRVDLAGALYIGLRGPQLNSVAATNGTTVAQAANGNAPAQTTSMTPVTVDEFRFPVIRDDATKTTIGGSMPAPVGSLPPMPPPRTSTTATCSWNFVRGDGAAPPPPRSTSRDRVLPGALGGATGTTAGATPSSTATAPGGTAPVNPSLVTTAPGGTATVSPLPTATVPGGSAAAGATPTTTQGTLSPISPTKTSDGGLVGSLTAVSGPCTLAGPVVLSDQTVVTPGGVQLVWNRDGFTNLLLARSSPVSNAVDVEYTVTRTDLAAQLGHELASTPRVGSFGGYFFDSTVTFRHSTKLDDYRRTYVYAIRARHYRRDLTLLQPASAATNYLPVWFPTATYEDGCGETRVSITPPRALTPLLTDVATARGAVTIGWKMPSDQQQTGFLVLGPGLPSDGKVVAQTRDQYAPPCCSIQVGDLPAGSLSWLVIPIWDTPDGRSVDASAGLRVSATIAPWTNTSGPAPTGIRAEASSGFDVLKNTCSVTVVVNWMPVPGATGYTVYNERGPIGPRIPAPPFPFAYKPDQMTLPDLIAAAMRGANSSYFVRGVQVKVVASFADRPDTSSDLVPVSISTYPCWDHQSYEGDPIYRSGL